MSRRVDYEGFTRELDPEMTGPVDGLISLEIHNTIALVGSSEIEKVTPS